MADEKETRIDFRPEPEAPVTGSTTELERDPNSSNLFYIPPELFTSIPNLTVSVDMSEGSTHGWFKIEDSFDFMTLFMDVSFDEPLSGAPNGFVFIVSQELVDATIDFYLLINEQSDGSYQYVYHPTIGDETQYNEDYDYITDVPFCIYPLNDAAAAELKINDIRLEMDVYDGHLISKVPIAFMTIDGYYQLYEKYETFHFESAYREAKIDLDPIFSSKLITVGQLSRLTGSGTASGAQADKLLTMGQLARLTGKQAPAEDKKSNLVTVGQAYSVV